MTSQNSKLIEHDIILI